MNFLLRLEMPGSDARTAIARFITIEIVIVNAASVMKLTSIGSEANTDLRNTVIIPVPRTVPMMQADAEKRMLSRMTVP